MRFTLQAPPWIASKCFHFLLIRINQSNKYNIEWCPVLRIIQLEDTYAVVHDIEISTHYLLNWKQLNATIFHQRLLLLLGSDRVWNLPKHRQHLLLLLGSSTGLEEYLLHSKRQCPLFIIFDNKSCSIWSLTIFDNDQTLMLIHLGYSVDQSSLDNE